MGLSRALKKIPKMLKVAFEGCCHGELNKIYSEVDRFGGADLVLIAGDFQSIRNKGDLSCLAVPQKFLKMGDFHQYYSLQKKAKYLTIVIGGNHEASNYLSELFYGGWLAPNIYYLGKAGSVIYKGLRISGISGIYKEHDFRKGHFEKPPYDKSTIRSVYHVRDYEVNKLACLANKPDIMLSHDWPNNIEKSGNTSWLKRTKPFFRQEIDENSLGSPPLEFLLHRLKPRNWLSAHLHVHFEATVQHQTESPKIQPQVMPQAVVPLEPTGTEEEFMDLNNDEISLDFDDLDCCDNKNVTTNNEPEKVSESTERTSKDSEESQPQEGNLEKIDSSVEEKELKGQLPIQNKGICQWNVNFLQAKLKFIGAKRCMGESSNPEITQFVALDKCFNRSSFLKIIEIESKPDVVPPAIFEQLCYDVDWLAITKAFRPHLNTTYRYSSELPDMKEMRETIKQARTDLTTRLDIPSDSVAYPIPRNFKIEAPSADNVLPPNQFYPSSQTDEFCEMLGFSNHNNFVR